MEHQNPYKHLDDHSDLAHKQQSGDTETEKAKVKKRRKSLFS